MFRELNNNWAPTGAREAFVARSKMYGQVRRFFEQRDVLEVETPLMAAHAATDPYIQAFKVGNHYLQTSPEYAMKRMLAADVGSIYQICKAFRTEESGRLHNPEFTMLEWYRLGFDDLQLIDEMEQLLQIILGCTGCNKITYADLFKMHLDLDPHTATTDQLQAVAEQNEINLSATALAAMGHTDWLQMIMSHILEPRLTGDKPWIIYNFPAPQAALAKVVERDGIKVAARFEVYINGIELANGYFELQDYQEQERRFTQDIENRQQQGLQPMQADGYLIAALQHGMPECAGVALGLDRLLMCKLGANSIAEVLSFTINNA